jgi:hypothetical protein
MPGVFTKYGTLLITVQFVISARAVVLTTSNARIKPADRIMDRMDSLSWFVAFFWLSKPKFARSPTLAAA